MENVNTIWSKEMTECEKENFHQIWKMGEMWYQYGKMYEALKQIASMEPGESYDEMCDIYEDCGTCYEMINIAKEALKKVRGVE